MKIILIILSYLSAITYLQSNDADISISYLKVMKRNKPTCDRLGNVYDACQWMLKFKINNNTVNDLTSFCSVIKINTGKYYFEKILPRAQSHYVVGTSGSHTTMNAKFN